LVPETRLDEFDTRSSRLKENRNDVLGQSYVCFETVTVALAREATVPGRIVCGGNE
jgi:hypothetical protein